MIRRRSAAALLAVAATLAALLPASPSFAATDGASLVVAPRGGGVLSPGDDLTVDVQVTNTGDSELPAGRVDFSVDRNPVASTSTLTQTLAASPSDLQGYLIPDVHADTGMLAAGASQKVRVRIDRKQLDGSISSASGARVLYVRFVATPSTGEQTRVVGKSVITPVSKSFTGRVGVGTLIPITIPAGDTGIVDTAEQAALTASGGAWDSALDAARADPSATIALDPAVLASIRLAGDGAPQAASDFLDGLRGLPNDVVKLPWADADRTLERAAGASSPIEPSSVAGVTLTSSDGNASATPAPSAGTTTPSLKTLTAWNWSKTAVSWPVPRSTTQQDIPSLGAGGTSVVLGTGDVQDSRLRVSPAARIGGTRVLVSDERASALLTTAAAGGIGGGDALARLVGLLGTDAVSGEARSVLLTTGRSPDLRGLSGALGVLQRAPWLDGAGLDALTATAPVSLNLASHPVAGGRVAVARDLIGAESAVEALGAAATGGSALVAPERLALTGLLSAAWRSDESGWLTAAAAGAQRFRAVVGKVSISASSDINYLGTDGSIAVNVANHLAYPVAVVVDGQASNGRLQVTGSAKVVVPGGSFKQAKLPVRSITNGHVDLTLWLSTPQGVRIGATTTRSVTVRAGFEAPVAIALIVALGLLFATGVYRNLIRRRKTPREATA